MGNVLKFDIDPDISLDESRIKGMSDNIKGNLLVTMTLAAKKYDCHWTELVWKVKMNEGQPVIYVNKRK